jgi:hypothetical protein
MTPAPTIWILTITVFFVLGFLAFRGARWAYLSFVALGLLFFPARVGFHLQPAPCDCRLTVPLAWFSLTNYKHIVLFAIFFLMTGAQWRHRNGTSRFLVALAAVLAMGVYVELAEGITGRGHCRLRDLIPDLAGALAGAALLVIVRRRRPAAAADMDHARGKG